ncbi:MAG: UDP-N-acetylmuramoyl-tripeptide--D-alanyl-D-alanine ligase [Lysobacterales bacterium]
MNVLASQIASWTGGRLVGADVRLTAAGQDTRTLPAGALYVALRGERADGHDFAAQVQGHAGAALVERELPLALPQIVVADSERALQSLAQAWLQTLDLRCVAMTGSNGKTTTKMLTASILRQVGPTHATPGNYNNEIGVPLTVLGLDASHRYAVIEMGCGKPGDIDLLAEIAPPHAAAVINVAPAHLERLGSVEGVAIAKAGIYRQMRADGIAVIPAEDRYADYFRAQAGARRRLEYAVDLAADVRAEALRVGLHSSFRLCTPAGSAAIELRLPGRHHVHNALAAATLALAVGAPLEAIAAGLASAEAVDGRGRRIEVAGSVVYDDSYNANPGSLAAAIETLALDAAPRWLVLGDMAELGTDAAALHARCGALARERGIERLYAIGPLSAHATAAFGSAAQHFERIEDLIAAVQTDLAPGVTVLVKGSRSARMERVVQALTGGHGGAH